MSYEVILSGDVILVCNGMLTLASGSASDAVSRAPAGNATYSFWLGWYHCKKGQELRRWENTKTYVAYYVTKGKFKILSKD